MPSSSLVNGGDHDTRKYVAELRGMGSLTLKS